jgi:hypothetical protein
VDKTVKKLKGIAEYVWVKIDKFVFLVNFIIVDMHEDTKISLILGRPFLSTARAKIDVFKRKISFRIGDDKVVFKNDEIVSYTIASLYAVEAFDGFMNVQDDIMEEVVLPNISLDHNVNLSHISPF